MRALLIILLVVTAIGPARAEPDGTAHQLLLEAERAGAAGVPSFDASRRQARERMVETQIRRRGVDDEAVLDAMRAVPRHRLVPGARRERAYSDRPLPIGHGQTISQPFIVAYMTEQLALEPGDRVLEVGTGSGYQAAVLGAMGMNVVTIEIIRPLAERAAAQLDAMGFGNITVLHGDGYFGHPPGAPYQAIIVTAAAQHVPPPLIRQLEPGGRMVIPVGRAGWTQNLLLVSKDEDGSTRTRNLMSVAFVPLTGDR
jgi:protein-L-isoaspartate(D-aspartate) O-methyltransferase